MSKEWLDLRDMDSTWWLKDGGFHRCQGPASHSKQLPRE